MTRRRLIFWALVLVTVAVYLTMAIWTLPRISAQADGNIPFDLRPFGYDFDAARAFLAALSGEGLALYHGPQRMLDLAFPALEAALLIWLIHDLSRDVPRGLRAIFLAAPIAGASFDYLENLRVAGLLDAGADGVTAGMVADASRATVLKSGFVTFSVMIVLFLALRRLWQTRSKRTT